MVLRPQSGAVAGNVKRAVDASGVLAEVEVASSEDEREVSIFDLADEFEIAESEAERGERFEESDSNEDLNGQRLAHIAEVGGRSWREGLIDSKGKGKGGCKPKLDAKTCFCFYTYGCKNKISCAKTNDKSALHTCQDNECCSHTLAQNRSVSSFKNFQVPDDLLTIPNTFYKDIGHLKTAGGSQAAQLLEDMLEEGRINYRRTRGNPPQWQCVNLPRYITVPWLHVHTFSGWVNGEGIPKSSFGPKPRSICVKVASEGTADGAARMLAMGKGKAIPPARAKSSPPLLDTKAKSPARVRRLGIAEKDQTQELAHADTEVKADEKAKADAKPYGKQRTKTKTDADAQADAKAKPIAKPSGKQRAKTKGRRCQGGCEGEAVFQATHKK